MLMSLHFSGNGFLPIFLAHFRELQMGNSLSLKLKNIYASKVSTMVKSQLYGDTPPPPLKEIHLIPTSSHQIISIQPLQLYNETYFIKC